MLIPYAIARVCSVCGTWVTKIASIVELVSFSDFVCVSIGQTASRSHLVGWKAYVFDVNPCMLPLRSYTCELP